MVEIFYNVKSSKFNCPEKQHFPWELSHYNLWGGFLPPFWSHSAGYPHCKELLIPFCGVQYHLQEWELQIFSMCFVMYLIFCYNNPIGQQMQRSYSTFVMLKHTMLSSVFLEFSSNASEFSFSLPIIHLTSRLAFLLLCALSRISFKILTMMRVQYPLIHTKQPMPPFLLILMMITAVVSLNMMMLRQILRLSYAGMILQMKCGEAT